MGEVSHRTRSIGLHQQIMESVAAPLHFSSEVGTSEDVVLHRKGQDDETRALIVRLPIQFSDSVGGQSQIVSGDVLFPPADRDFAKTLNSMTIRGELFQIQGVGTETDGFIPVQVTRRRHETKSASNSLGGL